MAPIHVRAATFVRVEQVAPRHVRRECSRSRLLQAAQTVLAGTTNPIPPKGVALIRAQVYFETPDMVPSI